MLVEDMRNLDGCGMEKLGTLNSGEKTIAVVRDRWWPQTAKEKGDKTGNICFM